MCSTTLTSNIVREWLKSLCLGQYADSFIDNGYDDLEICKQIGDPDLDAIGVFNPVHRTRLLESVRTLREEGAASVYFTLEENVAVQEDCYCDSVSAHSQTSSSEKETTVTVGAATSVAVAAGAATAESSCRNVVVMTSPGSEGPSGIRQIDEYEEGKAELVRIPRMKLQSLLRDKLSQDGIRLGCQPYSTTDGERGYLEGLASRYADLFCTHYGDVLNHLEELRKKELAETSTQDKSVNTTPNRKYANITATSNIGITSSQSQPIYVPGKYSPSSCLSDKEEDEIYGFGYGVFGVQIARQQQQRIMAAAEQGNNGQHNQHYYQTCLSPRSAFFYEFPPNESANYANMGKKRTTFSRFLRGLKTAHRKEKHGGSSPRHGRATSGGAVPQRVDTPDSVLQSGLGIPADLAQSNVLRSMIDPRDYDRLRYLQMNGGAPSTFEETIYRLKVQEAQKKREKITKEHEEILRNIREGLMHLGKDAFRGPLTGDDTYMYDEDVRMLAPAAYDRGHWYDEPPYESDPEDFLMRGSPGPTATIENGRVCFTLNQRQEQCAEGIISLRSAGDISLPKEGNGRGTNGRTKCRKLLISRRGDDSPSLTRMRESGDYAGSDIQSVSSRISTLSMDTSRSEQLEFMHFEDNIRKYHKKGVYTERLQSPSHSSDYEDQEDYDICNPQIATVHVSDEGRMGVSNLVGRVRGLREDVQKKITKLRGETNVDQEKRFEHAFPCSTSSIESIPSGSGSSTQALVRAGSNHSSISVEDIDSSPADPQIIGRARALVDYTPTPYDKEALKFKKGDIIDILSMNASGQWKGICHGQKGIFKFINVELMSERSVRAKREPKWHYQIKNKPKSVEDLLQRIGMPEHISVFVLNGYEDLELFKEIEPSDLDYLGILNTEHRAKLLAAVQLLHDLDSGSEGDVAGSSSEGDDHTRTRLLCTPPSEPFIRCHYSRESNNYSTSGKLTHPIQITTSSNSGPPGVSTGNEINNLDSVVEQCSNEILARVRQVHKNTLNLKEESSCYQPNITDNPIPNFINNKISHESTDQQGLKSVRKGSRCEEFGADDHQKMTTVKYIVGGNIEMGIGETIVSTANVIGKGGCFSEKSSDSGISSSSMCSTNTKDSIRQTLGVHSDTLSRFSACANRASSKMTKGQF